MVKTSYISSGSSSEGERERRWERDWAIMIWFSADSEAAFEQAKARVAL